MKIAFISDIHSNKHGLLEVLKHLKKVDSIICAGDITGYYPFPNEVIKLLIANKVISIIGNHDKYLLVGNAPQNANSLVKDSVSFTKKIITKGSMEYLKNLSTVLDLVIDNKRVQVCHGSPWDNLEERIYPDYSNFERFKNIDSDVIVLGHTHYPMIKNIGNKTIINPGSCGQPRDFNSLSYAIWDTKNDKFEIKRVKWDIEKFKKDALKKGTGNNLFNVFSRTEQN